MGILEYTNQNVMAKRITVVLDDELVKKLRNVQSMKIRKSKKSVSFSSVINEELRKVVKSRNNS